MFKKQVVNKHDYTMFLEDYDGVLWFHSDVHNWTPLIKKQYVKDLNALQALIKQPLYALIHRANTKLAKFATLIGFKCNKPFLGKDSQMYFIYSRSL